MKRVLCALAAIVSLSTTADAYEIPEEARYPYVSTYYVKPVVTPAEETRFSFFVTDWNNSKVRFDDDSHRFSARLRYSSDGENWTELVTNGLHSGDHVFALGKLPVGDYTFGISVTDEAGRDSHTVWHEFRSREPYVIPEAKTWRVTARDLADYGLVAETNRYSFHLVDATQESIADKTNGVAMVKAEMVAAAAAYAPTSGTYAIFAPANKGKLMYRSWKMSTVAYAADYDFAAVEAEAATNVVALQKMLNDAVANGYEKIVLPKGVYRVSGYSFVTVPGGLTVDLNGATVKMNGCTGSSGKVFVFTHAHDAHLVNGTIEGDYYEHDYAGSPNNSEWILGVSFDGDCRYSSLEGLKVWRITGYGVSNGTRAYDHTFGSTVGMGGNAKSPYVPGALRLSDGTVDTSVTNRFTSAYKDISKLAHGYLMVSKYLGYQGIRTKSWYYVAAFYDADKNYLHGEVAFQYRNIPIPKGAKYLRITVDTATREDADACEMSAQHFKTPWNCAFRNLHIELCRAVGMAQSAMRNMLVEDCDFSYSGDNLATCAYDAEDGWDMMQDVYIHRNVFHDNPNNEFLTCAGHNFILEENVGKIHLYSRTCSPCVRNNTAMTASFLCDTSRNRTMHGRYENNRFGTSLRFGGSGTDIGWDICLTQKLVSYIDGQELSLAPSRTGRIRDCTVEHAKLFNTACTFGNVTFTNVHFIETEGYNTFTNSRLISCYLQHFNRRNVFLDSELRDTNLSQMSGGTMAMTNCTLRNVWFEPSYWSKPVTLDFCRCTVTNENKFFFRPAIYTVGSIRAVDCDFDTGTSPVFDLFDLRAQDTDVRKGRVTIVASTCSSGGFLKKGSGSQQSTKTVHFESCCNLYDGDFVTKERFLNGMMPMWTRTVVPSDPAGGIRPGETVVLPEIRAERLAAITNRLPVCLSDEDAAAGLDVGYLLKDESRTAGGLRMGVAVNEAAVEATVGPLAVDTEDEEGVTVESADGETGLSATVKTVPGLWYGFTTCDTLDGTSSFQPDVGSFQRADGSGRLRLTSSPRQGASGFFRVSVAPAKPEIR